MLSEWKTSMCLPYLLINCSHWCSSWHWSYSHSGSLQTMVSASLLYSLALPRDPLMAAMILSADSSLSVCSSCANNVFLLLWKEYLFGETPILAKLLWPWLWLEIHFHYIAVGLTMDRVIAYIVYSFLRPRSSLEVQLHIHVDMLLGIIFPFILSDILC